MSASILKVRTRHQDGLVVADYVNATFKVDGGWLLITHDDTPPAPKQRLLSRVPLANVVQILEPLPEKAS